MGNKATKKVATRRIDMIDGNVDSNAQILNGPHQPKRIKAYNDLAASVTVLQKEKDELKGTGKRKEKKKSDAEKAARKAV